MEKVINLTPEELQNLLIGYEVTVAGSIGGESGLLHLSFERGC